MYHKMAEMLCAAASSIGQEYEIRKGYTGGPMPIGDETTAIFFDDKDSLPQVVAEVMSKFDFYKGDPPKHEDDEEYPMHRGLFTELLENIRYSTFGLDTVIY